MGAQEIFGEPQIRVHVRGRREQRPPQPARHAAREPVVDRGGAEQDQFGQSESRAGGVPEPLQSGDYGGGAVLAEAAAGDIVVGGDDEEDGFGSPQTFRHELDVVDAAFEHTDALVVKDLGHQAMELRLVAAVSVDLVLGCLQQVLDECRAAIPGAAQDGVERHDRDDTRRAMCCFD